MSINPLYNKKIIIITFIQQIIIIIITFIIITFIQQIIIVVIITYSNVSPNILGNKINYFNNI